MAHALDPDQLGAGNGVSGLLPALGHDERIVGAVDDQRRCGDRAERRPTIAIGQGGHHLPDATVRVPGPVQVGQGLSPHVRLVERVTRTGDEPGRFDSRCDDGLTIMRIHVRRL